VKYYSIAIGVIAALLPAMLMATVFGSLRGIVHDPDHRPVPGAQIVIKSTTSDYAQSLSSGLEGSFETPTLPAGAYRVTVTKDGFAAAAQEVVVVSGSAPILHFQLSIGTTQQTVVVSETALAAAPEVATPTTLVSRSEIQTTPGADLSNSLNLITDYVPGAWITHDQLHVRGGHQVTWAIDGVPIPNTNIASNVGPQIDPKDIDYLEAQRGGYSADQGDRTYGVFNVVPRTGFEGSNEGEFYATYGTFHQTNEQVNFGSHTEKLAYFASLNGNRSDYGLETPGPDVLHDRAWGLGGLASLIYNRDPANQFRFITSVRGDDYQIPNDSDAQNAGGARARRAGRLLLGAFLPAQRALDGIAFLPLQPRQLRRRSQRRSGRHHAASGVAVRWRTGDFERGDYPA
jgi:hypothetical protein